MGMKSDDISRMISFIELEAQEKIEELNLQGQEEYSKQKANLIKSSSEKLKQKNIQRLKDLKVKRVVEINRIHSKFSLKILQEKERIVNELFDEVRKRLKNKKISKKLINQLETNTLNKSCKMFGSRKDLDCIYTEIHEIDCIGGVIAIVMILKWFRIILM